MPLIADHDRASILRTTLPAETFTLIHPGPVKVHPAIHDRSPGSVYSTTDSGASPFHITDAPAKVAGEDLRCGAVADRTRPVGFADRLRQIRKFVQPARLVQERLQRPLEGDISTVPGTLAADESILVHKVQRRPRIDCRTSTRPSVSCPSRRGKMRPRRIDGLLDILGILAEAEAGGMHTYNDQAHRLVLFRPILDIREGAQ